MEEGNSFIRDSLFCEWGYILNLDEGVLEVYQGFQKSPHDNGRYSDTEASSSGYYGSALIVTFPLDNLPSAAEFMVAINLAPFDSIEDAVLNHFEDCGDLSEEDAETKFGITDMTAVVKTLKVAGHEITDLDGGYELA